MMIQTITAVIAAGILIGYWAICRRASLKHREKAAELVAAYIESEKYSHLDKESVHLLYKLARHWLFMPLMTPVALIAIVLIVFRSRSGVIKPRESDYNDIMDNLMKMYMTRNPLTAMVCMSVVAVSIIIIGTVGMLFDRLKVLPSAPLLFGFVMSKVTHRSEDAHAH